MVVLLTCGLVQVSAIRKAKGHVKGIPVQHATGYGKGHGKDNHRKLAETEKIQRKTEADQKREEAAARKIQGVARNRNNRRQKIETDADKTKNKNKVIAEEAAAAAEAAHEESREKENEALREKENAQRARCTDKKYQREKFLEVSEQDSLQLLRLFQISQPKQQYSEGGDRPVYSNKKAYHKISQALDERKRENVRRVIPFGKTLTKQEEDAKKLNTPFLGDIFQHLWAVSFNVQQTGVELSKNLLKISTWGEENSKCWSLKEVRKELKYYLREIGRLGEKAKYSKLDFDKREEEHLRQILLTQESARMDLEKIVKEMQRADIDFFVKVAKYQPPKKNAKKDAKKEISPVWKKKAAKYLQHYEAKMFPKLEQLKTSRLNELNGSGSSLNSSDKLLRQLLAEDKKWRRELYGTKKTAKIEERKKLAESLFDKRIKTEKKATEVLYAKELKILRQGASVGETDLHWLLKEEHQGNGKISEVD